MIPALPEPLLPVCEQRGIGVVAAGVFNSGLLARRIPARDATDDHADAPPEFLQRAVRIAAICEQHASSLPAAALAFPLGHPAVVSICIGARSPEQVERNAALRQAQPPSGLWTQLKAEGLLRADAPVPRRLGRSGGQAHGPCPPESGTALVPPGQALPNTNRRPTTAWPQ